MREKLASLPLNELRELAKANHIKGTTALRKADLIERLLQELVPEPKKPDQKVSEQETDDQKTDNQKIFEQKVPEQKAYDSKASDQKTFEQKSSEQQTFEQKSSEQQTFEQKSSEQKVFEQRTYNQKPYTQKTYDQRSSDQKAYRSPSLNSLQQKKAPAGSLETSDKAEASSVSDSSVKKFSSETIPKKRNFLTASSKGKAVPYRRQESVSAVNAGISRNDVPVRTQKSDPSSNPTVSRMQKSDSSSNPTVSRIQKSDSSSGLPVSRTQEPDSDRQTFRRTQQTSARLQGFDQRSEQSSENSSADRYSSAPHTPAASPVSRTFSDTTPLPSEKKNSSPETPSVQPITETAVISEKIQETAPSARYSQDIASSDPAFGILELNPDGYGFLRSENYLTGDNDVYVSPAQIRKFNMKTGDSVEGVKRIKAGNERFAALLYVNKINGFPPYDAQKRPSFEDLTPIFPHERLKMETPGGPVSLRILDLLSPIGKGQRGMIVSPPKAGKTTLLKSIAKALTANYPSVHLIVLLIDERPEEVTDIRESIEGEHVDVIYSTFDEEPEHHKRVAEMVLERAKRLVEHRQDVVILLDSITRLTRAYNLTVIPSGRTLSGGLDPAALYMPKKFFGAARCMREGGSLTILASALTETGSRMDDVVFEEFKGTGNMELVLDRKLSERRIFPAIDICRSGTRREDLLLTSQEAEAVSLIRKSTSSVKNEDSVERILDLFSHTRNNQEFIDSLPKTRL